MIRRWAIPGAICPLSVPEMRLFSPLAIQDYKSKLVIQKIIRNVRMGEHEEYLQRTPLLGSLMGEYIRIIDNAGHFDIDDAWNLARSTDFGSCSVLYRVMSPIENSFAVHIGSEIADIISELSINKPLSEIPESEMNKWYCTLTHTLTLARRYMTPVFSETMFFANSKWKFNSVRLTLPVYGETKSVEYCFSIYLYVSRTNMKDMISNDPDWDDIENTAKEIRLIDLDQYRLMLKGGGS